MPAEQCGIQEMESRRREDGKHQEAVILNSEGADFVQHLANQLHQLVAIPAPAPQHPASHNHACINVGGTPLLSI